MAQCAIGIGSNLGDPAGNVRKAIAALRSTGEVTAVSRLYHSEPWGLQDQPPFVNAVVLMRTLLDPRSLLNGLQSIERDFGRVDTVKWGPRIIDLDILYYDDVRMNEPDLQIPHPYLEQRPFVVVPLAEIDSRYAAAAEGSPGREGLRALT
ncbi:MAG: 2-amino-4-hydroxy-6-hydroxymethyldihydropteridine diphosphokinase [Vulcanimicrobiaceae bacterium]